MTSFLFSLSIFLSSIAQSNALLDEPSSSDLRPWTIAVLAYSHRSTGEFRELESVARLVAQETAKGFLNRTTVSRDAFHYGATFCLVIDHRVDSAVKQRERILGELKKIRAQESDMIFYEIDSPSDCFAN